MSARTVEIRLLGELEVLHGGRVQALPASKKTRALLAYLVATAKPQLRERLCALLWDGPDDPRAALRWSLTKIRPLLDEGATRLAADRERVAFDPEGATVDTVALRAALADGVEGSTTDVLRAAAQRFRGEFLEGLDLPSCYRFHEWCVGEREELRALRVRILAELRARLEPTAPEEALAYARERVRVDPLTEAAHVDVVRLLGRLGRVREAQAQYETCRRILETELGARTSQALEQARMELGRAATTATAAAPAEVAPAPPAAPPAGLPRGPGLPLVGRVAEVRAIDDGLAAARAGRAERVLLFLGDQGLGKTRLLDELARRARAAGGRVLEGRGFDAEMVRPYGAWIDALRSSGLGALPDAGDRALLYDAVARLLAAHATAQQPLALLLDDLQWLDEASAGLLHYVAREPSLRHVVIGCAARAGELGDNAPVLRVVRALEREQRLDRRILGHLDGADMDALVRAAYPTVDAAAISQASDGHPLYALEIARAAASGARPSDATLDDLIDERLARLDDGARELLPWAAALGRTFAPEILSDVTSLPSPALLEALETLERHGIVRPTGTTYDFAHDLLRQAAYRSLSEPRRRLVHLQIARVLQATRAGDETLSSEIAHHATLGGNSVLAAAAYVAAAERSVRLFALAEAAELAKRGLPHVARLERRARIQHHISLLAVQLRSVGASPAAARVSADLTRLVIEAQDLDMHADAARGLFYLSMAHYMGENFDDAQTSILRAIDAARDADPLTQGRQLADSARCLLMLDRDVPRARAMLVEARAVLGPGGDKLPHVAWARGLLDHFCGETAPALAALGVALEGYQRDQAHWETYQLMAASILFLVETGDAAAAVARCPAMREVAAKMPEGSEPLVATAIAAVARLAANEPGAALECDDTVAALKSADAKAMQAYVLTWAADHALSSGDLVGAERRAAEALAAAGLVGRRSECAVARAILGRVALARHDSGDAKAQLEATREDRARPLALSARALARLAALEGALESSSQTIQPTRRRTTAPS